MKKYVRSFFLAGLFLVCSSWGSPAFALQNALVKAERAIIYAEPTLKTELGFVSKGRIIQVGLAPLGIKNKIFSIIVDQKIAFIQAKDIHVENESEDKHHEEVLEKQKEFIKTRESLLHQDKRDKKNISDKRILVEYRMLQPGDSWRTYSSSLDNEEFLFNGKILQGTLELDFFHPIAVSLGMNILSIKEPNLSLSGQGFHGGVSYIFPWEDSKHSYIFTMSGLYYPNVTYNLADTEKTGPMSGYQASVNFEQVLTFHFLLRYGIGYYYLKNEDIKAKVNFQSKYNLSVSGVDLQGFQLLINAVFRF